MITKKDSSSGRSSTSRTSNGPPVRVKRASDSGSSCCDVLLEHSYCISGAASSSGAGETNGCSDEQVLHDEQLAVIDQQQEQQRPEKEDQDESAAGSAGQQPVAAEVSERSRRVRRIPAKFMPDDRLFDDVAEFPHPVHSDPPPAPGHNVSGGKKVPAKDQKQNPDNRKSSASDAMHKPAKESDVNDEEEDDEEEEDEDDDDDDPYKEYCICRKPHGNRFMIACDHCEDWFHGSCIGISKKQSEQYESWVCQTCRDNDPGLAPVLKDSAKQKQQHAPAEKNKQPAQRRVSQTQSSSESSDSGEEKPLRIASTRSSPAKAQRKRSPASSKQRPVREKNGALEEFEKEDEKEKQRLREVIEKAKREHAEKVKRRERRQGPLDPTMNQLFQVSEPATLKSPTKTSPPDPNHQRIRCMICRSERVNSDKTIFCSLQCIKHHVRRAKKKRHADDPQSGVADPAADPQLLLLYPVFDAFDPADIPDAKRKKDDVVEKELVHFLIRNPGYALDAGLKVKITSRKGSLERSDSRKSSVSDGGKTPTTPATPLSSHPLKRKSVSDADPVTPAGTHKHRDSLQDEHKSGERDNKKDKGRSEDLHSQDVRDRVLKAFQEALEKRVNEADDLEEAEKTRRNNMTTSLAKEIEKSLFQLFQIDGKLADAALKNYLAKYRSLIFNFNNSKNRHLLESLFAPKGNEKHISPEEVVRMTPEELARGSDLDAWRKIEAKRSLINSVIVSEEASDGPKLKKTRKGEEEIQNDPGANDSHEHFVTPDVVSDKTTALNPLEMILKEIKSSSKSSNRRDDVEGVPKSPVRDSSSAGGRSRRVSEATYSPPDLPISPDKRKKSIAFSDEDSSSRMSSRTEVKRVKIAPEITSILSTSAGDGLSPEAVLAAGRGWSERKILWEGFCSGFEDPNASSSFNPAMNSGSRFPVVCRTLVTDSEVEPEKLPLPLALNVVGRIAPEQVSSYVQKLVQSTASSESIVEMIPLTLKHKHAHLFPAADSDFHDLAFEVDDDDDESLLFRENFNKFINYLSQRKRYAVVDVKSAAQSKKSNLKDVYLLPFDIPVTGEAAAVETRSSQLPSKMMADIFDNSPFTQEIRNLKPKKPISILIMLLIKKAGATSSTATRERSGSSSSTSTTSSSTTRSVPRRLSSHPPRDDRIPEERSFTPPPQPSVTTTPQLPVYIPTPIRRTAAAAVTPVPVTASGTSDGDEYEPSAYIPGLSPDRNANPGPVTSGGQREEEELRQKALIQMRLLHSS